MRCKSARLLQQPKRWGANSKEAAHEGCRSAWPLGLGRASAAPAQLSVRNPASAGLRLALQARDLQTSGSAAKSCAGGVDFRPAPCCVGGIAESEHKHVVAMHGWRQAATACRPRKACRRPLARRARNLFPVEPVPPSKRMREVDPGVAESGRSIRSGFIHVSKQWNLDERRSAIGNEFRQGVNAEGPEPVGGSVSAQNRPYEHRRHRLNPTWRCVCVLPCRTTWALMHVTCEHLTKYGLCLRTLASPPADAVLKTASCMCMVAMF